MRPSFPYLLPFVLALVSCSEQTGNTANAQSNGSSKSTGNWVEGRDYTVLERIRFMDNDGFQQPAEAFSVLLPKGWKHDGGIAWKGLNECRGEMVSARWSATSPDGALRYRTFPAHSWASASDPMMMQSLQMAAQNGGCEVGGSMDAEAYLREVFAPRELDGATVVQVKRNEDVVRELERTAAKHKATLEQYGGSVRMPISAVIADLRWSDGSEGIALCSVTNLETAMQNAYTGGMQYLTNSFVNERSVIRFPKARRAEAEQVLANIKTSFRTNPEWQAAIDGYFAQQRQAQDRQHHQRMAAIDQQTRNMTAAHNQRMNDIQAQGAANTQRHNDRMAAMDNNMRSWEQQQASQDRQHTRFVQTIREVETWQGSSGKVELSSGYDQAWSRGDGTYILSNKPGFDPSSAFQDQNWTEMKRADP